MPRVSAGLLPWRRARDTQQLEVLIAHMGGPFWADRDANAWSIIKGELQPGEEPLAAALREFAEETGLSVQAPTFPLTPVRQAGGKVVHAFALHEPDLDPAAIRSNTFTVEWPPRSGVRRAYPEIDRAAWYDPDLARLRLVKAQAALVDELKRLLGEGRL